ncbi:Leukocyte receptor cluster [Fasciola gigantica]|uniref:Leukocyte receptor cluster n=1 Tax=Fasciola gigantica TaxID=46835 RepID=A0A504Y415_FASGI|nr:Leukocyte receptor cluster [Fasciola gigantica]
MERILKEKLEYIFRNNIKIDWTKENIPTIPSKTIAAIRSMSNAPRSNSVNVVRPAQLLGPRGMRATGPARGSHVRLPVGMLARGGRNIFSGAKIGASAISQRRFPSPVRSQSHSRSRSRSPVSPSTKPWLHRPSRRASLSRSESRSKSSDSHRSSASSSGSRSRPSRRRRTRSRSTSRCSGRRVAYSASRVSRSPEGSVSPPVNSNRKNRRRKRGGRVSDEPTRSANGCLVKDEDAASIRGYGRGGRRGKANNLSNAHDSSVSRLSYRASRFKDHLGHSTLSGSGAIARTTSQLLLNMFDERDELSTDFESFQIVGTMQELEKRYLRLTRAPEPSEVRPLSILKLSLEHVKQKWTSKTDYHWVCEQFKSIRQDLIVQGIEDEFAIAVYEAHADAALEAGDFEEFHQCQSQLLRLYKEGAPSSRFLEFTAYRLLYYIFTLDLLGINTIMAGLRPAHKSNPCVRFALELRSAWSLNNYWRFFRLLFPPNPEEQPPLRCAQVVQWFIGRERKEATKTYLKVCVFQLLGAYVKLLASIITRLGCEMLINPKVGMGAIKMRRSA